MEQKIAQSRLIYVKFYYYFICFSDLFNFFVAFVLNFLYFFKNKNVDFFSKILYNTNTWINADQPDKMQNAMTSYDRLINIDLIAIFYK